MADASAATLLPFAAGGPPLKPTEKSDVRRWRARHKISVWEMHTRDCPTCRRAHDR